MRTRRTLAATHNTKQAQEQAAAQPPIISGWVSMSDFVKGDKGQQLYLYHRMVSNNK